MNTFIPGVMLNTTFIVSLISYNYVRGKRKYYLTVSSYRLRELEFREMEKISQSPTLVNIPQEKADSELNIPQEKVDSELI